MLVGSINEHVLASVVATNSGGRVGGRRGELQLVLAAVPVCARHGNVQAEHHELQPEEADIWAEFGQFVLAGVGVSEGGGVAGVLEVAGVVGDLQSTPSVPDDTASSKPRGAGTIGKPSSSSDTF